MSLSLRITALVISAASTVALGYLNYQNPALEKQLQGEVILSASTTPLPLAVYCPGPLAELGGKDGTELGNLALIGKAKVWGAGAQFPEAVPVEIELGLPLNLSSTDQTTLALSVLQTQSVTRPRMTGLSSAYCSQPQTSGYFANGMASLGRESILHLANPGSSEVQITLSIFLPSETKSQVFTLAPGEDSQISLAALADAEPNFGLGFLTNGPGISAYLQNRTSSGLNATGVELVAPTAVASSLFIPGFRVFENQFEKPQLSVLNPGSEDATARVIFHGVGNSSDVLELQLPAGQLTNLELDLVAGEYFVELSADAEIAASIWSQLLAQRLDFAWLNPMSEFTDAILLAVPELETDLILANTNPDPINLSVLNSGQYQSVTVPALSNARVSVLPGEVLIQGEGAFSATLQMVSDRGFTVLAPAENLNLGSNLEIAVR